MNETQISIVPLLNKINEVIINPLILLLFALATVVFVWGIIGFLASTGSDDGREKGKRHMLWGLIGMVIMVSVYGIIRFALSTFGIETPEYIQ